MSVNLTHFTGFICSFSFFYFLRFSAPPFCLCLSIFVNHFFHTKLFCKVHGWTGMVGEGLVILRNLTGQSSVSNENEPVGCCQCLWSWWAVGQVCLPPGKCSVWQNTSPAPVVPQSCCFFFKFLEVMEHLDFKIQYNILKYNIFIMKDALHLQRRCEMLIKIPLVKKTIFGKHHEHLFLYCSKIFQQCSWGNSWWQGMSILPANSNPREELISKTRTPSGGLD